MRPQQGSQHYFTNRKSSNLPASNLFRTKTQQASLHFRKESKTPCVRCHTGLCAHWSSYREEMAIKKGNTPLKLYCCP